MRFMTALLFLTAACGDNIHPADPDAAFDFTDVTPPKPEGVNPGMPADAGVDAAPDAAECDDAHEELNGHEHKCQHDRP